MLQLQEQLIISYRKQFPQICLETLVQNYRLHDQSSIILMSAHPYFCKMYLSMMCCTDKRAAASLKFKPKNAACCADRWLRSEIECAACEDVRFIITLGKDVERWFERNGDALIENTTIRVYHLPHPSGANMASWHPKDEQARKKLEENITNLVLECQDIS